MTAKDWFLFWCGVIFGQAPFWVVFFGWKGAMPSAIAAVCMGVILYRVQQQSRKLCACGHPRSWHWHSPNLGCSALIGRGDNNQYIFCSCELKEREHVGIEEKLFNRSGD